MNKFRVWPDGRTAYEKITEHKCRSMIIGFDESVDYIFDKDKGPRHKADSRVYHGMFLGYVWRSTECLVRTRDGIYNVELLKIVLKKMPTTPSAPSTPTYSTMIT